MCLKQGVYNSTPWRDPLLCTCKLTVTDFKSSVQNNNIPYFFASWWHSLKRRLLILPLSQVMTCTTESELQAVSFKLFFFFYMNTELYKKTPQNTRSLGDLTNQICWALSYIFNTFLSTICRKTWSITYLSHY